MQYYTSTRLLCPDHCHVLCQKLGMYRSFGRISAITASVRFGWSSDEAKSVPRMGYHIQTDSRTIGRYRYSYGRYRYRYVNVPIFISFDRATISSGSRHIRARVPTAHRCSLMTAMWRHSHGTDDQWPIIIIIIIINDIYIAPYVLEVLQVCCTINRIIVNQTR